MTNRNNYYDGYYEGERLLPYDNYLDSFTSIREKSSAYARKRNAEVKLQPRLKHPKQSLVEPQSPGYKTSTDLLLSGAVTDYYKYLVSLLTASGFFTTLYFVGKLLAG